jgi:hypothetical protein
LTNTYFLMRAKVTKKSCITLALEKIAGWIIDILHTHTDSNATISTDLKAQLDKLPTILIFYSATTLSITILSCGTFLTTSNETRKVRWQKIFSKFQFNSKILGPAW